MKKRIEATKEMYESKDTEVVVILDRSGSMASIKEDARGGFNTFLEKQKSLPEDGCKLTLILFDDQYDIVYDRVPIKEVPNLTVDTYIPRGMTALLDAIGRTINRIRSKKVMCGVITDGEENASREFSRDQIFNMISTKKESGWEFIFLAANQDAIANGTTLGFSKGRISNFAFTKIGMASANAAMADTVSTYRTYGKVDNMPEWTNEESTTLKSTT
jgi:hypothetical protein